MLCPKMCTMQPLYLRPPGTVPSPCGKTARFPPEKIPDLLGVCLRPPGGVTGFWVPEIKALGGVEDSLQAYLASVWTKSGHEKKEIPEWKHYYRQVGGIIRNDERQIFISYAWAPLMKNPQVQADRKKEAEARGRLYDPDWWKTQSIFVQDGGWMFFRVIYDPKKKQFVWYDDNANL